MLGHRNMLLHQNRSLYYISHGDWHWRKPTSNQHHGHMMWLQGHMENLQCRLGLVLGAPRRIRRTNHLSPYHRRLLEQYTFLIETVRPKLKEDVNDLSKYDPAFVVIQIVPYRDERQTLHFGLDDIRRTHVSFSMNEQHVVRGCWYSFRYTPW